MTQTEDIKVNWDEQYLGAAEEFAAKMSKSKGKEVHAFILCGC